MQLSTLLSTMPDLEFFQVQDKFQSLLTKTGMTDEKLSSPVPPFAS